LHGYQGLVFAAAGGALVASEARASGALRVGPAVRPLRAVSLVLDERLGLTRASSPLELKPTFGVITMKVSKLLLVFAAAAGLAAAAGSAFADACKDVKFKVTNNHFEGRDIEVRKVKYFNPHTGSTHTEDVKNLLCKPGSTCITAGDNLTNAKNIDLNSIQVVFSYREHDGQWSKEFTTQKFVPAYRKCTEGKTYGPIVVSDSAG
jgi:hypothetical protein